MRHHLEAAALPAHTGRDLHQQGDRGDEEPHPARDPHAGLGCREPLHAQTRRRTRALRGADPPERTERTERDSARLLPLHGADHRQVLPAHSARLRQGAGARTELQRRDRVRDGAHAQRRRPDRAHHRGPGPEEVDGGVLRRADRGERGVGPAPGHPAARRRELFKEGNRPALQSARSKEELERLVRAAAAERDRTQRLFRDTARKAVEIAGEAGLGPEDFSNGNRGGAAYLYRAAEGGSKRPDGGPGSVPRRPTRGGSRRSGPRSTAPSPPGCNR